NRTNQQPRKPLLAVLALGYDRVLGITHLSNHGSKMATESKGKVLLRVRPRGFCAGVVRAVDIVELALEAYGAPVYVHHEIVHNTYVVEQLRRRGAIFVEAIEEVPHCAVRSEEHTSELQSRFDLVCRLLLENKTSAEQDGWQH